MYGSSKPVYVRSTAAPHVRKIVPGCPTLVL
jgi:hypothetical protein